VPPTRFLCFVVDRLRRLREINVSVDVAVTLDLFNALPNGCKTNVLFAF
jgi:hypothetical protein